MKFEEKDIKRFLGKWQKILKLMDWNIKYYIVEKEWRKSGDIKIDMDDKKAMLMINNFNPRIDNLESLIIHELLHLKLWGMDQMIEELLFSLYGKNDEDPKMQFAYGQFMTLLESTVESLAESFVALGAENKEVSFGRVMSEVKKELQED